MHNINWKAEALAFAKENDSRNHMVLQLVEKAMKRGAEIVTIEVTKRIQSATAELEIKHRQSAPHSQQTKTILL